jgi:hypothetical protein
VCITLIGRLSKPAESLCVVFLYSFAVVIDPSEVELCLRISLLGGLAIPSECFIEVFGHSFCLHIPIAKFVLSGGISLLSMRAKLGELFPLNCPLAMCSPSE